MPYELMFGRIPNTTTSIFPAENKFMKRKFKEIQISIRENWKDYDKKRWIDLPIGQIVLVKKFDNYLSKMAYRWSGPYQVIAKHHKTYTVIPTNSSNQDGERKYDIKYLKPYFSRPQQPIASNNLENKENNPEIVESDNQLENKENDPEIVVEPDNILEHQENNPAIVESDEILNPDFNREPSEEAESENEIQDDEIPMETDNNERKSNEVSPENKEQREILTKPIPGTNDQYLVKKLEKRRKIKNKTQFLVLWMDNTSSWVDASDINKNLRDDYYRRNPPKRKRT